MPVLHKESKPICIYIASCTEDGAICRYVLSDGTIRPAGRAAADRPMYLYADRENMLVYALLREPERNRRESALAVYDVSGEALVYSGRRIFTGGTGACHLCMFRGHTYAANYHSGSVFSTAGKLAVHDGPDTNSQGGRTSHTHFIFPSPDNQYLLCTDLGLDRIYTYDEHLHVVAIAGTDPGDGPRHLAYSKDGCFIFCANELSSSVTVFTYRGGKLEKLEKVSTLDEVTAGNTCAAIRVKDDYVYVSNRGADVITCFQWDGAHLLRKAICACGGHSPRDFAVIGSTMVVANERTDKVTFFKVQGEVFEKLDMELHIPHPICVTGYECSTGRG